MKITYHYKTLLLLLIIVISKNINAQQAVEWKNITGCASINTVLTKTTTSSNYNASATSANVLNPTQDGWASFTITQLGQKTAFGFSQPDNTTNQQTIGLANIEYAFETNTNNKLKIYASGTLLGTYGNVLIGDILKIERIGLQIKFYRNNTLLRTNTLLYNNTPFIINTSLATPNSVIANATTTLKKPLTVTAQVYDVISLADTLGSIVQNITGGVPPYTISWTALSPEYTNISSITIANVSNIDIGQYQATVKDANQTTLINTYTILNKIDWRDSLGVVVTDSSLKKSNTINSWTNSGAYSLQEIKRTENGFISHRITALNAKYALGVSRLKTNYNYTSMEYCFIVANKKLAIYKKGKLKLRFNTNLNIGDDIYMQRRKDTILFYHNNLVFFKEKVDSLTPLKVQTSLFKGAMELRQTRTNYRRPLQVNSSQFDVNCRLNTNGQITILPNGGSAPYVYTIAGQLSTSNNTFDNLPAGTYTVTIVDKVKRSTNYEFTIYNCPIWISTINATLNDKGNLIKNAENSWENTILNTNEAFRFSDTAAWMRFVVPDSLSEFMIGFRSIEFDSTAQGTNYKLYVKNSIVTIIETDNDGFYNKREIKRIATKTEFTIQLTNDGIEYYSRTNPKLKPTLEYTSKLFSSTKLIIETNLFKTGSKVNAVRVSGYGNTVFPIND